MSNEAPTDALRLVPVEPTEAVLTNMAIRFDHGLGCPGYYDNPIFGEPSHARRFEAVKTTMRQLYEEVVLSAAAPASPLPGGGWQDISTAPRTGEEFQAWWKGTWQPRARFDPEYGSFQLWGRTDYDTEGWETFEIDGYWQPLPAAPTGEPK